MTFHMTLQVVFPTRAVWAADFLTGHHIASMNSFFMATKVLLDCETRFAAFEVADVFGMDSYMFPRTSRLE